MTNPLEINSTEARRQGRSPSYPAIDLERAVDRVRTIFEKEKQYPTPVMTVVSHWKYKTVDGNARLVLAALKKFGLLEVLSGKGNLARYKVTDLAIKVLNHPDEKIRLQALQEAALTPTIHREFWTQYGDNLPSEETLKWNLTRDLKFTDRGAREFIDEYQATVKYAQLASTSSLAHLDDLPDYQSISTVKSPTSERLSEVMPTDKLRNREFAIPLPGDKYVTITGPFPLNELGWNQLIAVLQVMKPGLISGEDHKSD